MVFGKRQILMATLILALGVAIYLHSTFNTNETDNGLQMVDVGVQVDDEAESEKNYGDTQFVTATSDETMEDAIAREDGSLDSDDYFIQARLTRQQTRDAAIETLQGIIESETATEDEKNNAVTTAADIATAIDVEGNIENLVRAKGFSECMAYIDEGKATVVVKTEGLLASEAAQIKDIIVSEAGISAHNISITEVQ